MILFKSVLLLVSVDLNALSSPKMRVSLPVLPGTDAETMVSFDTNLPNNIEPWPKSTYSRNSSSTPSGAANSGNPLSINDSVYGYKSIVLKKITEEGLKEVIKHGSKSKATATITYKVQNFKMLYTS